MLAHLMNTGLGPFYDGLLHLFLTPEDLLPVVALSLLAGMRGPVQGRAALFALPLAWLAGAALGHGLGPIAFLPFAAAGLTIALGGLAAADRALSQRAVGALAITLGLLHGAWNGGEIGSAARASAIESALGSATAVFVIVALLAALVSSLRAPAARIVVRVASSWIAAAGIFMLGWTVRGR